MTEAISEEERRQSLYVTLEQSEDIATISLKGELVGSEVVHFRRACAKAEKQDIVLFLIDLAEVDSIDGYGLSSLVGLLGRLRATDGHMVLCGLNPDLRTSFEATHCDTIFETAITLAKAEDKLRAVGTQ